MEFLQTFISILVDSGLDLTIADRISAEQAITSYPRLLEEKSRLKTGLRSLLARNYADLDIFNHCFDVFFSRTDSNLLTVEQEEHDKKNPETDLLITDQVTGSPFILNDAENLFNNQGGLRYGGMGQVEGAAGGGGSGSSWVKRFMGQDGPETFLNRIAMEYRSAAEALINDNVEAAAQEAYNRLVEASKDAKQASRKLKAMESNFHAAVRSFKRSLVFIKNGKPVEGQIAERVLKRRISMMVKQVKRLMLEQGDFPAVEVLEETSWSVIEERKENFVDMPFTRITADLNLVKREIAVFGKKLATLESRRRRFATRGRLNIRKTIRSNLKNGGVLAELKMTRKRIRDPSIILLNDISGSTGWISEFFFVISYSIRQVFKKIRIYEFDSTVADVTPAMKNRSLELALKERSACWEQPVGVRQGNSNYESALEDFIEIAWNKLDKKTTVVLLADCRDWNGRWRNSPVTLSGEPLSKLLLKKIRNKVKRVIILNPEPENVWNSGDSCVRHYQEAGAEVYHVNTVKDIADLVYRV
ncbi:MAG: VWA domain-containing protein [Candidatus Odinarchaeota archaeon]